MLRIGRRPQSTGFFVDTGGVVRLMHPEPTWAETVDLAFTEIAIYGAPSPAVTRRLAAAYERLYQSVPVDLRVDIARHIALLEPLASAAIQPEHPWLPLAQIHEDLADDIAATEDRSRAVLLGADQWGVEGAGPGPRPALQSLTRGLPSNEELTSCSRSGQSVCSPKGDHA